MAGIDYSGGGESHTDRIVMMSSLLQPPERGELDSGLVSVMVEASKRTERNFVPDWEPRELPTSTTKDIHCIAMNTCATAVFESPGYVGTLGLDGCIAIGAGYLDDMQDVHVFLEHYTTEDARTVDDNEKLKVANLLMDFAAHEPLQVVIAYDKMVGEPPETDTYDPSDFPIQAVFDECEKKLPDGSTVLLVPYTAKPVDGSVKGHVFCVGRSASGRIAFDWNGHTLKVGKRGEFDDSRKKMARTATAGLIGEIDQEREANKQEL